MRKSNLDVLRIFSIFSVVLLHVSGAMLTHSPSFVASAYNALTRFCVPMFVMISGALFLNPEKELKTGSIYKKYIPRIAVAYIFWSIVYAFATVHDDTVLQHVLYGHYHLWFAPMIIGLYIATPVLRKIATDGKLMWYFLTVSFIFTILQPTVFLAAPSFAKPISTYTWNTQIWVIGYAFYYLLGYYLSQIELGGWKAVCLYILGASSCAWTIYSAKFGMDWFDPYLINTCLITSALFVLAQNTFTKNSSKLVVKLANLSFGIYLVHDLFLKGLNAFTFSPIWFIPVYSLVVFILSAAASWIISKIPIVSKFII